MNHQHSPEQPDEPVTLKKLIPDEEVEAAREFAVEVIGIHQPISYSRAAFMAIQSPEINQIRLSRCGTPARQRRNR